MPTPNMPAVTPATGTLAGTLATLTANYVATGKGATAVIGVALALALVEAVIRYARNAYGSSEAAGSDVEELVVPEAWEDPVDPADAL